MINGNNLNLEHSKYSARIFGSCMATSNVTNNLPARAKPRLVNQDVTQKFLETLNNSLICEREKQIIQNRNNAYDTDTNVSKLCVLLCNHIYDVYNCSYILYIF